MTAHDASAPSAPVPASSEDPGATAREPFHGWRVVALSAFALAATAPGQTAAVSAFVDPMIDDLGITRSAISTAYLAGTLAGAMALPWVGRALDKFGVRRTMAVVGFSFGAVLLSLAAVSSVVGLTAGFVGIRLAGQGALGLTATTATALWFARRRGLALGVVSSFGASAISLAPIALERLVADVGWRTAWAIEGLAVWAIVLPVAFFLRNRPSDVGQHVDGNAPGGDLPVHEVWGVDRARAMRTPFFWVVTASVATTGMLGTAVAFHQISLLGERGLSTTEAAANFLPQTVAALLATLATGVLVDRANPRWITATSMLVMTLGLLWGAVVTPGWSAIGFGLAIGAASGSIRSLEAAVFPKYFGTAHLGAIRGFVVAVSVGSTAFGPLLFALVHDVSGTYVPALIGSAAIPALVAAAALAIRPPSRHELEQVW